MLSDLAINNEYTKSDPSLSDGLSSFLTNMEVFCCLGFPWHNVPLSHIHVHSHRTTIMSARTGYVHVFLAADILSHDQCGHTHT